MKVYVCVQEYDPVCSQGIPPKRIDIVKVVGSIEKAGEWVNEETGNKNVFNRAYIFEIEDE